MVLFFVLFALLRKDVVYELDPTKFTPPQHELLMAFLRSPADIGGVKTTMAMQLQLAEADNTLLPAIEEQARIFFEKTNSEFYLLRISYPGRDASTSGVKAQRNTLVLRQLQATDWQKASIPALAGGDITISFKAVVGS